jgi:hypothetical protein
VKQRTSKIKAVVTEKQGERSKLSEDAKSTRKTMVAPKEKAPVKTKAKAKVSKPKKKRK